MTQKIFEKETSFTNPGQVSILRRINKLRPLTRMVKVIALRSPDSFVISPLPRPGHRTITQHVLTKTIKSKSTRE